MSYKIIFYKIFQNAHDIAHDIVIVLLILKMSRLHDFKPKNCV